MANESLVTKLTISAFKDIACATAIEDPNELILQVNPQEIALKFIVKYVDSTSGENNGGIGGGSQAAVGNSFTPQVFQKYEMPNLRIDTIVDATGVLEDPYANTYWSMDDGSEQPTVEFYIERMKKVLYNWQSEEHGPPFLLINWGSVLPSHSNDSSHPEGRYKCQLGEMEIKYTLFSAKGFPIRAEIALDFIGVEDPEKAVTGYSPDLSHLIEVKYGDNLPAMCKKIYGSPEFFLQIAKVNNLPSIYAIEPGMKLVFPPLEKASR